MKSKIMGLLAKSNVALMGIQAVVTTAPVTGEADNEVVYLSWTEGNLSFDAKLTEEGLENAKFEPKTQCFVVDDQEGDPISFKLLLNGTVLTPFTDEPAFLVIQEGGSTAELYANAFSSKEAAENFRRRCKENGSYRTSEIMEVPGSLAEHPVFYSFAEGLLRANMTLGFPENA